MRFMSNCNDSWLLLAHEGINSDEVRGPEGRYQLLTVAICTTCEGAGRHRTKRLFCFRKNKNKNKSREGKRARRGYRVKFSPRDPLNNPELVPVRTTAVDVLYKSRGVFYKSFRQHSKQMPDS